MAQAGNRTTITTSVEAHRLLRRIADDNGWSVATATQVAIQALARLLELHAHTAEKASEPDVAELVSTLIKIAPAELVEGKRIDWGRLSDGRPAVVVAMELDGEVHDWTLAPDAHGDIMAARNDGAKVGFISGGRLQPVAAPLVVEEPLGALT